MTSADSTPYTTSTTGGIPVATSLHTRTVPFPDWGRPPPQPDFGSSSALPTASSYVPSSFYNRPPSGLESRPRSSPSTFGPSADSITWPQSGLGIRYGLNEHPTAWESTFDLDSYQPLVGSEMFASPSPPSIAQPQPRRQYPALAPNPAGLIGKRSREDEDEDPNLKRRKRTSSIVSADLSEDDRLLVMLKEDEGLPWKDIAARFGSHHGKTFQVAALQMRYKRLREKFRVWQGEDVEALRQAHEYWEKYKWEIISSKVSDTRTNHSSANELISIRCSSLASRKNGLRGNAQDNGKLSPRCNQLKHLNLLCSLSIRAPERVLRSLHTCLCSEKQHDRHVVDAIRTNSYRKQQARTFASRKCQT